MLQIDSQMRIKKNALNKDIRSSACCLIRALSTAACSFLAQLYSFTSQLLVIWTQFLNSCLLVCSGIHSCGQNFQSKQRKREILVFHVWLMKHSAPYNSVKDSMPLLMNFQFTEMLKLEN